MGTHMGNIWDTYWKILEILGNIWEHDWNTVGNILWERMEHIYGNRFVFLMAKICQTLPLLLVFFCYFIDLIY